MVLDCMIFMEICELGLFKSENNFFDEDSFETGLDPSDLMQVTRTLLWVDFWLKPIIWILNIDSAMFRPIWQMEYISIGSNLVLRYC